MTAYERAVITLLTAMFDILTVIARRGAAPDSENRARVDRVNREAKTLIAKLVDG